MWEARRRAFLKLTKPTHLFVVAVSAICFMGDALGQATDGLFGSNLGVLEGCLLILGCVVASRALYILNKRRSLAFPISVTAILLEPLFVNPAITAITKGAIPDVWILLSFIYGLAAVNWAWIFYQKSRL